MQGGGFVYVAVVALVAAGCTQPTAPPHAASTAEFVAPATLLLDDEVDDRAVTTTASFSDGEAPLDVLWRWGDGTSSTGTPATHSYRDDGVFTIDVEARHPAQGVRSGALDVVVGDPLPPDSSSASATPSPSPSGPAPEDDATDGNATHGNGTDDGSKPFEPQEPDESCGGLGSLQPVLPTAMDPVGAATGWPLLALDVVMIADPTFVAAHSDWEALLVDLVEDASARFEDQVGLVLRPVLIAALPPGSLEPGRGDDMQRAVARGFMHANQPDLDFDYVAVILGADYNGSTAGQVECVHGAVNKENAYLWAEYDENRTDDDALFGVAGIFEDIPLKVFMHESAHLFAAHHHYTQCGATMTGYGAHDTLAVCGVMINDIGLASYTFSQTNRLVMRSFVEEIGIGEPVSG